MGDRIRRMSLLCASASAALVTNVHADGYPSRFGNPQNTADAGYHAALDPERNDLTLLRVVRTLRSKQPVNATPVASDGLLFFGDYGGTFYVVDVASGTRHIAYETGDPVGMTETLWGTYTGVQSTAVIGDVTLPDGTEDRRVYFGANLYPDTFHCLSVTRILAAISAGALGDNDPGTEYVCAAPANDAELWPMPLAAPAPITPNVITDVPPDPDDRNVEEGPNSTYQGSPLFRRNQLVQVGEKANGAPVLAARDVIYAPSTGLDCSNGQLYAIDAFTGQRYWTFDAVSNGDGKGGVIWTKPAMSADGAYLYVTTGDCVQKPQVGERAESLIALDPRSGKVLWAHQRRLVDTADLDIGNSPTVVDVADAEGAPGCHNIVSVDKDGCIYGFRQKTDIPAVGEPGFDPLRVGQQRLLWRRCFVTGSLNGGFNAQGASFHGRTVFAQTSPLLGRAPGDDSNAFAVDACTGDLRWASSSIGQGRGEGVVASGVYFQPSGSRLYAARADAGSGKVPTLLATVALKASSTQGGGGPSVAAGRIHVPTMQGVDVIEIVPLAPGEKAPSPPQRSGSNLFAGPYPAPLAPTLSTPIVVDPNDPYPAIIH